MEATRREVGEPWTSGGDFPLPWTMLAIQQLEAREGLWFRFRC